MVLTIVLAVLGGWVLAAVLLALLIGRAVRIADRRHRLSTAARTAGRAAVVRAPEPRAKVPARI